MAPIPPPVTKPTRKVHRDDMAILVVDDDRFVRESVRRVLHRAGYRVLIAGGADEALDIVGRVGPFAGAELLQRVSQLVEF